MSITCNFEKDDQDTRKTDRMIVRIAPGQVIGNDTPSVKTAKNGAYLWVMDHRRRNGKSWRDLASVN